MKTLASRSGRCLLGALGALAAAGCATAPLPRYDPALSEVDIPRDHQVEVQMLVSLVSVGADEEQGLPAGIEARIRLENHADVAARIAPGSLELVGANLESFPAPRVSPADGVDVDPGGRAILTARFPYPPGEDGDSSNVASVNLRWRVDLGGKTYAHGLTFHRAEPRVTRYYYAGGAYGPGPYYWGPGWTAGWWGPPVIVEDRDADRDRD